jgi:hypothetical protein
MASRPGIELTPTCWISETDLGMREWAEQGRRLGVIGRGVGWWLGDWLRYGNQRFGERYVRASRITGYDVQTLTNMVYVASRFEPEERREGLSWSHHAEVAACPLEERRRWLDLAESERLSVRCLREEMRRARRLEPTPDIEPIEAAPAEPQVVCPECGCRFGKEQRAHVAAAA